MGAMPVIAVKPNGQFGGALLGCVVGSCVGPLAQAGLNEALGLSVGLGRVGFGSQMLDPEPAQGLGVAAGAEARAIVGHDALDLDAEASKEPQGVEQEKQGGDSLLVRQDFRIGEPGVVVDRQMHIFPADPAGLALAGALAGDAVADAIELAELFDVDVDDLAGSCALVAADRLGGSRAESRLRPSRFRMRLIVAAETPTSAAICSPVWRCRRKASTLRMWPAAFGLAMSGVGTSDPASRRRPRRGTARSIWRPSSASCGTRAPQLLSTSRPPSRCAPSPLDLWA